MGLALVSCFFETRELRRVFGCSAERREAFYCSKGRRRKRRRAVFDCCQMNLREFEAASSYL